MFKVLIFSGRYALLLSVGLVSDVALEALHRYRVSFQNPARFQNHLEPSKGLDFLYILPTFYAATGSCLFGRFMSINILLGSYTVPLVKIVKITLSSLHAITISDCIFLSGFSVLVV